jgi:hypothetical protein
MKKFDEFRLTNELLKNVVGGQTSSDKVFSFNGENAVEAASLVQANFSDCACGCSCFGQAGSGSGGGGSAISVYAAKTPIIDRGLLR